MRTPARAWRPAVTRGALLLMESLWIYALVAWYVAAIGDGGKPTFIGIAVLVFASFSISRALQVSDLSIGIVRVWGLLLSVLIFYCVIRADFFGDWRFWDFSWADRIFYHTEASARANVGATFAIPLLWVFWMRGVLRGQQRTGFEDVATSFAIGLVVIAVVLVLGSGTDDLPRAVELAAIPYVAIGLLAIALSHASRAEDEFSRSFAPTWILATGAAIGVLALVALLFALVDYGAAAHLIGVVAAFLAKIIAFIFYVVTYPFLWAMEKGLGAIRYFLDEIFGGTRRTEINPVQEPGEQEVQDNETRALPAWLQLAVRIFIGGSFVTLLLLGTALLFTKYRRRADPTAVKESIYTEGRLAADLGSMLGNLLGRLRPNLHLDRPEIDAASRLYFDVLATAHDRGIDRKPTETPLELAPRLDATFASDAPRQITDLFDDVRYGTKPPPPDEVQRLRTAWESAKAISGRG